MRIEETSYGCCEACEGLSQRFSSGGQKERAGHGPRRLRSPATIKRLPEGVIKEREKDGEDALGLLREGRGSAGEMGGDGVGGEWVGKDRELRRWC